MRDLAYYLGIHPLGALATVIATVILYFTLAWVLRSQGQRLNASPSSLDLAVIAMVGALVGRATMGRNPTLAGGILALATLLVCERLARRFRRGVGAKLPAPRAVAVMVAGEVDSTSLAQLEVDEASLWSALRAAGVSTPSDAGLVVLESTGRFSVLRSDTLIHASALTGVRNAEDVHRRLTASGLAAD